MHSQMCISVGNFWKKCIFWEDFLQASKPGRGRELTKGQTVCLHLHRAVQILSLVLHILLASHKVVHGLPCQTLSLV